MEEEEAEEKARADDDRTRCSEWGIACVERKSGEDEMGVV